MIHLFIWSPSSVHKGVVVAASRVSMIEIKDISTMMRGFLKSPSKLRISLSWLIMLPYTSWPIWNILKRVSVQFENTLAFGFWIKTRPDRRQINPQLTVIALEIHWKCRSARKISLRKLTLRLVETHIVRTHRRSCPWPWRSRRCRRRGRRRSDRSPTLG